VAVLGFLQEFSSTALTKHFKTDLNQKKRAGIGWNKSRNKYFQISGAISLERLGTTTQPHARALVLIFLRKSCDFFCGEAMIFYGMTLYFYGKESHFHGNR
jgi:hypothetical protein